ncbi:carboxylesterase/lipase family protein [Caulobacter sp. BK020]|uniref:carboxylesterase/lipase family protein n=1 Tax=Caulobacter sp. BK020 TaxID=2512117 RepID=UPI001043CABE|nr:carboxylesterase/lipase family protein [Caulobacter sp. BK020]TCS17482.1 para-nitrobenzyl esterase [Caulobacter sp. BK020]
MTTHRRAVLAGGAAASLVAATKARAADEGPIVATRYGRVRGAEVEGIKVFKGVRYGADTAPRRFRPALPPKPWPDVVDALAYGPASPQAKTQENTSEDCLFLNVWTPGLDGRKRPVMVYVHGGAHANGSGSDPLYDGVRLARRGDVVVVTVNHRLNVFGYAYLAELGGPDLADSGNVGNLDLVMALEWVRDNIAAFGGDPGNVTAFGQSGGGAKVVTMMAMPAARGLFHKAATMSGQHVTAMGPIHATIRAKAFMERLGLRPDQVDVLRTLPAPQLVEALKTPDPLESKGSILFWSVMDGGVLPRHPFYPDAPRESAHIPMIIGNTHDETRAFLGGDPRNFTLTWDELPQRLAPELVLDVAPRRVIARYRELYPHYTPSEVFFAATTAGRSWPGHLIQAEQRARIGAPAWMYQLDFGSPIDGGKLRAFHGFDIALVFDNLDKPGSKTGTGPAARKVAHQMSEAFLAFARTGDPNCAVIPAWSKYTLPRRSTLVFDETSAMVDDPRKEERELFSMAPFLKEGT